MLCIAEGGPLKSVRAQLNWAAVKEFRVNYHIMDI